MVEIVPNWHPIFVHFTVALLNVSVGFFVLASVLRSHRWRDQWLSVAHWNLWLGSGFAIVTVIAGWFAFNSVAHDPPSHAAMTDHRNWAFTTLAVVLLLSLWSMWRYRAGNRPNTPFLVVTLIMLGLLASTGWRGGELVYRYGLGVMSLPKPEGKGHTAGPATGEAYGHGAVTTPMQEGSGPTDSHDRSDDDGEEPDRAPSP